MHELLGQEFAHTGAQNSASIRTTAVGRRAAPLELHLPALVFEHSLKNGNCSSIAVSVSGSERTLLDVFRAVDRQGIAGGPAPGMHGISGR